MVFSSCQSAPSTFVNETTVPDSTQTTPFQPLPTSTPPPTATPQPTLQPLPEKFAEVKIDGIKAAAEFDAGLKTWVWKDKKGVIRRLVDPLSGHLLVRTYVAHDRLTYEVDSAFKWEVNLVNYSYYPTHAPFGIAYVKMLKSKFPELFAQANEQTGIIFRILQINWDEMPTSTQPSIRLDAGTEKERFFLRPVYLPATNEYVLTLGLKTDFLTQKGAINTYSEEMLNYCPNAEIPANPSGVWGLEVYKHPIK